MASNLQRLLLCLQRARSEVEDVEEPRHRQVALARSII
jgi:hypothetical protein